MSDRKYLKLRHNTWYFQKRVPKALKALYPNTDVIEQSLNTGDIREARQRRDILIGQLQQRQSLLTEQTRPKQRFQMYVDELTQIAKDPFIGSDTHWTEVLDPETRNKTDDPEYIEAFRVVNQGKTTSDKYGTTLIEALQHFIKVSEKEDNHTEGTRNRYKTEVKNFLWFLNEQDIQLKDIERSQVFDFIDHQRESKSGSTVQGEISRLKVIWDHAYSRAKVTGDNPFDKHKINTSKGRKKKQPFTIGELKKLLEVVSSETISVQLLTLMGLYTGARISELVRVRLDEIRTDKDTGILIFGIAQKERGKTESASRWVPVPEQCKELLKQVRTEAKKTGLPYLFHDLITLDRGYDRHAYHATKLFGNLKRKHITDRTDKGFHSLRVMAATFLEQADVSEGKAARLLGHSKTGLTLSYNLYSKGHDVKKMYEAQSKAGQLIDNILKSDTERFTIGFTALEDEPE